MAENQFFDGREKDSLLGNLWTVYRKLWNEGGVIANDTGCDPCEWFASPMMDDKMRVHWF